jgi:DNA-binding GntR family transcriptional regulator
MSDTLGIMQPLYQKIYSEIKQTIINGTLSQSEKLPSENELCKIYNVSRITIRKALDLLTEEGWVIKIQGKGSFANPDAKLRSKIIGPASFSEFASSQGSTHKSIILKREIIRDDSIAKKLGINRDEDLLFIKRVLTLNEEPLMIDQAWLPARFFPNLLTEVSEEMSLYKTLATHYNTLVEHSQKELNVDLPNKEQNC